MLHLKSALRAVVSYLWLVLRRRRVLPPKRPEGGRLGLPADFLVTSDGTVAACHYGAHVYGQWSVDALLAVLREPQSVLVSRAAR